MALTQSKRKFLNHCKSLVLNPLTKCPTFLEFFNSLPGDNSEVSQGTCIDMLNSIEFVPESDLLFDPVVDKFAQLFIDMAAGKDAPRAGLESDEEVAAAKEAVATQQASEEPKAKKEPKKAKTQSEEPKAEPKAEPKKAKTTRSVKGWSTWVDKFIDMAGIGEGEDIAITALRSTNLREYYAGKQHCYVTLACRCCLLNLYRATGEIKYKEWALCKANKKTIESIKAFNWCNAGELV